MNEIHNPHNNYFFRVFSNVAVARDFIKVFLPKETVRELNLDTLELTNMTFVDDEMRQKYSDLIYKCEMKNPDKKKGEKYRYPSILFEHKSDFDPDQLPFQLGGYLFNRYNLIAKQEQSLGLIIPVVFYHGKHKRVKKTVSEVISVSNVHLTQYLGFAQE